MQEMQEMQEMEDTASGRAQVASELVVQLTETR